MKSFYWACNKLSAEISHKLINQRLSVLDAARGAAMLLVFASHFLDEYSLANFPQSSGVVEFIAVVCRVATPTFFLVSGIILGYLYRIMGNRFYDLRTHLIDKALFLLTIGHLLIAAFTAEKSGFSHSLSVGHVTDTLAFCAIGSLLLIPYTRAPLAYCVGLHSTLQVGRVGIWGAQAVQSRRC